MMRKAKKESIPTHYQHYSKDEKKWFLVKFYPASEGISVYFTDITEQVNLQKQKDTFLGIVSHELKTPVTSIKAFAQVLQKRSKKEGNDSLALYLSKMDAQLDKLTALIADLLDITKIQTGKLQFHETTFSF